MVVGLIHMNFTTCKTPNQPNKNYINLVLSEALKRKIVCGKHKEKWVSTKDGWYKLKYKNGNPKEIRMSSKERRNRSPQFKKA